jgi:pimeloyl-ACP methyl ester carboxylesterase
MIRLPGLVLTDHTFTVPLDHSSPTGATLELYAREVTAAGRDPQGLPWLLFLQGGPGGMSPRPQRAEGWLGHAVQTHRVLLMDQRGTGRSTPVTAQSVRGMADAALAAHLKLFRADSIVADAELIRASLGGEPWDTLGQSYGGFLTLAYLSQAPHGLRNCYVTAGLAGLTATPDEVYARTYPRVAAKNAAYYARYPQDVAVVRDIAEQLRLYDIRLPDGDQLTVRRLRLLGNNFGMSDGYEKVHWTLERAFTGADLADGFRYEVMVGTGFVDSPIFALQEFTYGGPGIVTNWAAARAIGNYPEFAEDADPLLFTGEMMYPWMFREIAALRPFAGAADLLAATDDWPPLYDPGVLSRNEVPVAAAIYTDDMYVDADLQRETARAVAGTRVWLTNEYEHNGLRVDGARILGRLMDMAVGPV